MLTRDERGQVLPWMLACTFFVLFFVGMSIDLWRIVAADRQTSTPVDAAAAAGASGIDEGLYRSTGTVALDPGRARDLAMNNLASDPDAVGLTNIDVQVGVDTVRVTADRSVNLSIMRLVSAQTTERVHAVSTATARRSP